MHSEHSSVYPSCFNSRTFFFILKSYNHCWITLFIHSLPYLTYKFGKHWYHVMIICSFFHFYLVFFFFNSHWFMIKNRVVFFKLIISTKTGQRSSLFNFCITPWSKYVSDEHLQPYVGFKNLHWLTRLVERN